jgi:polyisoprenoid-binding protein YceI
LLGGISVPDEVIRMETERVIRQTQAISIIDPRYTIAQFSVKNFLFFKVSGSFARVTGTIVRDDLDIRRSSVEAVIDADGVETGIKSRDAHLRGPDFFDSGQYPELRFQSTSVEKGTDRDTLRVTGLLTIRGKSREVVFDVTEVDRSRSPRGEYVTYYFAVTRINRHDFDLSRSRGIIGSRVDIRIHVQATRQA